MTLKQTTIRLGWFVGIWIASVLALAIVAYGIRSMIM